MKKFAIFLSIILGIGLLNSCDEVKYDPILDLSKSQPAAIQSPSTGSSLVLLQVNENNEVVMNWARANYNLSDLETIKYNLQMDTSAAFTSPKDLISTTDTVYSTTVGAMNTKLLNMNYVGGVAVNLYFRVVSYFNNSSEFPKIYSPTVELAVTPYNTIVYVKPIYMLGSATTVGWNNADALELTHLDAGKFGIVATLTAGTDMFVKFISVRGAWAPQWGTDATGTSVNGPLVYRPTESEPDPAAIPAPAVTGDYYIETDTLNLSYSISATSAQLFLVGDACSAGWDNANGIPFVKESPGIFTLTTNLNNTGGLKFLEISGAWAPQWGTDGTGTSEGGPLVYRPTEPDPDPVNIAAPTAAGSYKIELNLITKTYKITQQ